MPVITIDTVISVAYAAGFRGIDLVHAVAISKAESGWNTDAHNSTPPDDSWGLWQINMFGRLGEARRHEFRITSDSELADAQVNANAAHRVFEDAGRSFTPWSTYVSGDYLKYLTEASYAVVGWHNVYTLTRELSIGDTGADVGRVQAIIGAPTDGVFGVITRARVQRWQLGHGLKVDGTVGARTAASFGWRYTGVV